MKAIEFSTSELAKAVELIEKIVKAEYIEAVEDEMLKRLEGKDALQFIAGFRMGASVATVDPVNPKVAAVAMCDFFELAAKTETEGKTLGEAWADFNKELKSSLEGNDRECNCPKCRAEREAEEE